jgi:hypothetical protein
MYKSRLVSIKSRYLTEGASKLFTPPSKVSAQPSLVLYNTSKTDSVTVKIFIGATADEENLLLERTIFPSGTDNVPELLNQVLEGGEILWASASVTSTITASGGVMLTVN